MFTSLAIKNIRGFGDLKLEGLKGVTLVVGRNNVGKTALLEAVALACDHEVFARLPKLLRETSGNESQRFFRWLVKDGVKEHAEVALASPSRRLSVQVHRTKEGAALGRESQKADKARCHVISAEPRRPEDVVRTYSRAVKQLGGEERIHAVSVRVDPRVKKIRVDVADDGSHLLVDLGLSEMIPLTQAGQGLYRVIVMLSELVGEKPEICLIDEIENGVHHSVFQDIWTGLAEASSHLGIQLIATTHSRECLEAAHRAFSSREPYDLSVAQLFRVEGGIQGRVLDEERIAAALAGDIDLR